MERVKGNEAIKSKDFDEAITYYTRSIDFDQKMFQSYGNRALAYLKKKCKANLTKSTINALKIAIKHWQ
jgi:tetratricopeptide (TPR) repeat protein